MVAWTIINLSGAASQKQGHDAATQPTTQGSKTPQASPGLLGICKHLHLRATPGGKLGFGHCGGPAARRCTWIATDMVGGNGGDKRTGRECLSDRHDTDITDRCIALFAYRHQAGLVQLSMTRKRASDQCSGDETYDNSAVRLPNSRSADRLMSGVLLCRSHIATPQVSTGGAARGQRGRKG
jgi:hypothetical protein